MFLSRNFQVAREKRFIVAAGEHDGILGMTAEVEHVYSHTAAELDDAAFIDGHKRGVHLVRRRKCRGLVGRCRGFLGKANGVLKFVIL